MRCARIIVRPFRGPAACPCPCPIWSIGVEAYLDTIAGLVVTGGAFDVDPALFGADTRHESVTLKAGRTDFELAMTKGALKRDMPILGICGGEQLLAVALGGTLVQHIPDEIKTSIAHEQPNPRDEPGHDVAVVPGTMLARIAGTGPLAVNSAHHQAVKTVAGARRHQLPFVRRRDRRNRNAGENGFASACNGTPNLRSRRPTTPSSAPSSRPAHHDRQRRRRSSRRREGRTHRAPPGPCGLVFAARGRTLDCRRRVTVDGEKLTTPACVVTDKSRIVVDGKPLPSADRTRLWRYHKPAGLVTSHKDPQGRPTVFARLPGELPRVVSVGRLDLNSEGLLLLTNDGALARKLELPANGWQRRYRVRIHGKPEPEQLAALVKGVTIDGVRYGSIKAALDRQQGANAWLTVGLTEGRNREIRRVMQHLGFSVSRLIRVSYGPFQLGLLETGQVDEVPARVIKEQLGAGDKVPREKKRHKDKAKDKDEDA